MLFEKYFNNKYPLNIVSIIFNVLLLFVPHKLIKSDRILFKIHVTGSYYSY